MMLVEVIGNNFLKVRVREVRHGLHLKWARIHSVFLDLMTTNCIAIKFSALNTLFSTFSTNSNDRQTQKENFKLPKIL